MESLLQDMNRFIIEIGFELPYWKDGLGMIARLSLAIILGGLLGIERERRGRAAGLRTHMLVALGAALFTLTVYMDPRATPNDLSQVVKGISAGVGFLGAGAILKASSSGEIRGLTTAASIWLTAAIGLAAGAGLIWAATTGALFSWIVLLLSRVTDPKEDHSDT